MHFKPFVPSVAVAFALVSGMAGETAQGWKLDDGWATLVVEPYAPNIVRCTLSLDSTQAQIGPGYGIIAAPRSDGWERHDLAGETRFASASLVVTVRTPGPRKSPPAETGQFFLGSAPGIGIDFGTPDGGLLVSLEGWQMSIPNAKDGNAAVLGDRRPSDPPFFQVGATFSAAADERFYGLGQNQEGRLDHRGQPVRVWHDYNAPGGQSVGVPFLVTNKGYAVLWDNPSKTTVVPGFNEHTLWTSEVGRRVSFFVIRGQTTDELYGGYRLLTGPTPLLPKAAYGYIQCKQRYRSQDEVLSVARGYRSRNLPADMLVVDWFYYTGMGNMDFDSRFWPDPAAMNRELHALGFSTMISVWPRFVPASRYYPMIRKRGWFESRADGTPVDGLPYDRAGSDIDTTNPNAAQWFWQTVRDNILSRGFDSVWADETEPDLPPNGAYLHIGPGTEYFNVYPLFHAAAIYDGFRRDRRDRAAILSRDAYFGAQRNGTIFWSSDISPTWDAFSRQIPTGLDFTASGFAYWSNDTGGWGGLPSHHQPLRPPLLDPSDARATVGGYDDYPELYTRWFEYAAFQPIFRTHGTRPQNEVWSYGRQAEPILEKYLRLRYQLMPYIYSLAWRTHETGAPYMRALFMDFPQDESAADIRDEYMFGPALLVAPVHEQGRTKRAVYLPAGARWYDFWTNRLYDGGRTIEADAPIDRLPLFVRAGSILPLGAPIRSTADAQAIASIRVYPGADCAFELYSDDGKTYAYEKGAYNLSELHWNDAARTLTHQGVSYSPRPDAELVEIAEPPR